ncbi:MAG: M20 family metallopeptidase [Bacillota bacterium]
MDTTQCKVKTFAAIDQLKSRAVQALSELHANPELGGQEHKSSEILCSWLEEAGYQVQRGLAGLPTAFCAQIGQGIPGVALIAEYDALPQLGHACGHDWSGVCSALAAVALAKTMPGASIEGRVLVVGTPDEEGYGGKIPMIAAGVFSHIDAAMMVHAFDEWCVKCESLALQELGFEFQGKPAHAAAAPWEGINALDAVMVTFAGINCLRQHIQDGSRIHGIVVEGGYATNVIPERAAARVCVRARSSQYMDTLLEKVVNCAKAGALATGCSLQVAQVGARYESLRSNPTLEGLFTKNLAQASNGKVSVDTGPGPVIGSTDIGNLSQVVPTIQPLAGVAPAGTKPHTPEFASATTTPSAIGALLVCAKALSATVIDLLADSGLRKRAWLDFKGQSAP